MLDDVSPFILFDRAKLFYIYYLREGEAGLEEIVDQAMDHME